MGSQTSPVGKVWSEALAVVKNTAFQPGSTAIWLLQIVANAAFQPGSTIIWLLAVVANTAFSLFATKKSLQRDFPLQG